RFRNDSPSASMHCSRVLRGTYTLLLPSRRTCSTPFSTRRARKVFTVFTCHSFSWGRASKISAEVAGARSQRTLSTSHSAGEILIGMRYLTDVGNRFSYYCRKRSMHFFQRDRHASRPPKSEFTFSLP